MAWPPDRVARPWWPPPSQHLLHFLGHLIDPGIPVSLDEVEDPAHDRPPGRPQPKIKPPSATSPVTESTHSCSRKYWTAIAPPPIPVTTVLINPTAHSRVERGGVISITTMAESNAPPAAAPPAALNAAAPATPLLVGSGTMTLQCKKRPPKACASGGRVVENGLCLTRRVRPQVACQVSGVTRTTLVPSASSSARFPCATTTPLPAAVLNVVVNAPLLLQNTMPANCSAR
jgi:hypothetical protein